MSRGACANLGPVGMKIFFLERGQSAEVAQRYCNGCPVGAECEEYAHRTGSEYGVWNGKVLKRSGPDRASVTRAEYSSETTAKERADGVEVSLSEQRKPVRGLPSKVGGGVRRSSRSDQQSSSRQRNGRPRDPAADRGARMAPAEARRRSRRSG